MVARGINTRNRDAHRRVNMEKFTYVCQGLPLLLAFCLDNPRLISPNSVGIVGPPHTRKIHTLNNNLMPFSSMGKRGDGVWLSAIHYFSVSFFRKTWWSSIAYQMLLKQSNYCIFQPQKLMLFAFSMWFICSWIGMSLFNYTNFQMGGALPLCLVYDGCQIRCH